MTLLIVIFSFVTNTLYVMPPDKQADCEKEAAAVLESFQAHNPSIEYFGGCVSGDILSKPKKSDTGARV